MIGFPQSARRRSHTSRKPASRYSRAALWSALHASEPRALPPPSSVTHTPPLDTGPHAGHEPTRAGGLVAARARAVLAETEALRGEVDELRGLVRGRVNVGAMLFGGELDIPAVLSSFTAAFPQVEIGLQEGTARRMTEMLDDGSLDLAFALETEPPDTLERLELSAEELAVTLSRDHPLAADPAPVRMASLGDQALIAFQPGSSTRTLVDGAFARAGTRPRIALEANDFALVRALVARGVGIAILPGSFLVRPGPPIAFRPLSPPLRMRVVLWWRRGRSLSPAARAFLEFTDARRPRHRGG